MQYTRLANTWPWNKEWIALAFWVPGLTGLLMVYLTKPALGNAAYWFLGFSVWGFLFAFLYAYVSNKVKIKLDELRKQALEPTDGLVSFGKFQAPAAIALTKEKLYISAIVGPPLTYELKDLTAASMHSELPGKKLMFKKAFHLNFGDEKKIAIAVKQVFSNEMKTIFETVLRKNKKNMSEK